MAVGDPAQGQPALNQPALDQPALDQSALDDPGERGTLEIRDRALNRIATTAALAVPRVVRNGQSIGTRALPQALTMQEDGELTVLVQIAVDWPCVLTEVARAVQLTVADHLLRLTGIPVARADVSITRVLPPSLPPILRQPEARVL